MTEINIREIMVECLIQILERGEYSHLVLQKVLAKYQYLEKRQRAFLTRTVQGTLERRIELDAVLDQVEQDGQWYWLEAKQDSYANTSEALVYQRDDPRELTFTWTHRYGTLAPGHYRVTKSFFVLEEPGARQEFLLACEFTLE